MSIKLMSLVFDASIPPLEFTKVVTPIDKDKPQRTERRKASTSAIKIVLLALADHASDDGKNIYPSITTIEKKTGLSRQGVVNTIDALRDNGYLIKDGESRFGTTQYSINVSLLVNWVDYQKDDTSQPSLLDKSTQLTSTSQPSLPESSFNHQLNNNQEYTPGPLALLFDALHSSIGFTKETKRDIEAGQRMIERGVTPDNIKSACERLLSSDKQYTIVGLASIETTAYGAQKDEKRNGNKNSKHVQANPDGSYYT